MTPEAFNEARVMHGLPPLPVEEIPVEADEPAALRRRAAAARKAERDRLETLALIMSQPNGRDWMYWLLTECRAFHASDLAHSAQATAAHVGRREVAQQLLGDLFRACPAEFLTMLREQGFKDERNRNSATGGG